MLILARHEVEQAIDRDRLVDAVADAMAELSSGAASVPSLTAALVKSVGGALMAMPAHVPGAGALAAKLVGQFPENPARGLPSHVAIIAVFDPETGVPLAVMDGEVITAERTAAGSALSVRLLARPDAAVLAVLGTGVQARSHGRAVAGVRPLRELRVAGRDHAKAQAVAAELGAELGVPATGAPGYREAITGADIVCACTHSPEPVVRGEWLEPGMHVTSVGVNGDGPRARRRGGGTVSGRGGVAGGGAGAISDRLERPRLGDPRRRDHRRPRPRRGGRAGLRDAPGADERRSDHPLQVGGRRGTGCRGCGPGALDRAGGRARDRGSDLAPWRITTIREMGSVPPEAPSGISRRRM